MVSNWQTKKLSDIATIVMGQSPSSSTYNADGNGLPFFQGKAEFGDLYPTVVKWCTEPKKIAEEEDVLISVRAPVGPTNINPHKSGIGRGLAAIRSNDAMPPKLMLYLINNSVNKLISKSTGTTFKAIRASDLRDLELNVPPKKLYGELSTLLDSLFSKIDAGEEGLQQVQQQLEVYRQAVLKKAFEGRKHSKIKLTDLFDTIDGDRGKNYPKKSDYRKDEGYCLFLSTKNVRSFGFLFEDLVFITEKKHSELRSGLLNRGDIVITTRGTLGNVAVYDESVPFDKVRINSGMLILRPKNEEIVNAKYFSFFVQSLHFAEQLSQKRSGSAQPQIPAGVLKDFIIPVPELKEQIEIVSYIEKETSIINRIIDQIDNGSMLSKSLRQSILKKAFNGELI